MTSDHIWNLLLTLGMGAIAYMLKDWKSSIEKNLEKDEGRLDKLEEKLADLRAELPIIYVSRDDFLRAISGLDNRVDAGLRNILEQIQKMQKGG